MIDFSNVSKNYGENRIFFNLNFKIIQGTIFMIEGCSGSGKTTLMKLIAGLDNNYTGEISYNGNNFKSLNEYQKLFLRQNIGIIMQNPLFLRDKTVLQNVSMPLEIIGYPQKKLAERVHSAINKVGIKKHTHSKISTLSAGELQRTNIAQSIVKLTKDSLLIADEPTGNLDQSLKYKIADLLLGFNKYGITVVLSSHDKDFMKYMIKKSSKHLLIEL